MKKVLSVLLCLMILLVGGTISFDTPLKVYASGSYYDGYQYTEGIYTYQVNGGRVQITDVDISFNGSLSIPYQLGGMPVIGIDDSAFYGCAGITHLTIPNSVTDIGWGAFSGCTSLISVNIPIGVTRIADYAFYNCFSLQSIEFSKQVTEIGEDAFKKCYGLRDIEFNGTKAEKEKIYIGLSNESLNGVTWHCSDGDSAECSHYYYDLSEDGRKKCTVCGNIGDQHLHTYDEGVVTTKPNCKEKGIKIFTCTSCGGTKTETIAKLTSHSYKTVTTKATTSKNGSVVKACSVCGKQASKTTIYYAKKVKLSTTEYTYNGKSKKPSVKVYDYKGNKISSSNYTVSYKNNKKVGKATVTIKLKGNYSGTKTLSFKINPKETSVSKLTAGKKSLKVKINKQSSQATGYEIQYSTSKTFKSKYTKTKRLSSYKTTSVTLKSLKAKKTYYVRVRTYKTVDGKKYYSDWSSKKSKKTK